VKESFVLFWWIGVNHNGDVVNVDSTSSDVGGNKRVYFSAGQRSKVASAHCLRQVTMQFNAWYTSGNQSGSELARTMLCACKHQ
jgi:hypothetical protein